MNTGVEKISSDRVEGVVGINTTVNVAIMSIQRMNIQTCRAENTDKVCPNGFCCGKMYLEGQTEMGQQFNICLNQAVSAFETMTGEQWDFSCYNNAMIFAI